MDLISRQAAIDKINERQRKLIYCFGFENDAVKIMDIAKGIVTALPSAQPEIIRCGQCKYAEVADKEEVQDGYTCQFHRGSIWFSGSYCSWAERRIDD